MEKDPESLTSGWHYLDFRDGKHDWNYIEWKYFNFKQKDSIGYIIYFIVDPEQKTNFGGGRILARVFHKEKFSGSIRAVPIAKVQIKSLSANIDMGGASIVENDTHNYTINGKVDDLSWDLHYKQDIPSIEGFKDTRFGAMRWEKANWLIKMPRAKVAGSIETGGERIEVDAMGYSDTNWGEFLPFLSKYEWGQYSDERISFIFGVLYRLLQMQRTYFYLVIDSEIVRLEHPELSTSHTKWGVGGQDGIRIPLESELVARDSHYSIRFTSRLITSDLLGLKISAFLPKAVVSEQIVEYTGVVEKDGRIIHEFNGLGFKEWSTRTYKETPIVF